VQALAELDSVQVVQQLVIKQRQPVANAKIVFK